MNPQTVIVALVVLVVLIAIFANGIRKRKNHKGGCSCGGGCAHCPGNGMCHPDQ